MNYLARFITNIMGFGAIICWIIAAGTIDFHALTDTPEPSKTITLVLIGLALMIPKCIYEVVKKAMER